MTLATELRTLQDELELDSELPGGPWLVVAAHPDDETVGASWLLRRCPEVRLLYVTDGAPHDRGLWPSCAPPTREGYISMRAREACRALRLAGVDPECVGSLGIPDQAASEALAEVTAKVEAVISVVRPAVVVTHPYEGGHPDHDATAFAVQIALRRLRRRGAPRPASLEMTSYHLRDGSLETCAFLPAPQRRVAQRPLGSTDRAIKRSMLASFASQAEVLACIGLEHEQFRRPPRYDFTAPPHAGTLHFEALGWSMSGARWRELASRALDRLAARRC